MKPREYCQCEGECGQTHGRFRHCEHYHGQGFDAPGWVVLRPYGAKKIQMCDDCRRASDNYRQDLKKRQLSFGFATARKDAPPGRQEAPQARQWRSDGLAPGQSLYKA